MGPALEAKDILMVLQNHPLAPTDLKEKGILLAAESFEMHGVKHPKAKARELLESGAAWKKFVEIVSAQGVKVLDPTKIRNGKYSYAFKAKKSGKIIELNNKYFSRTSSVAGAPRDIYAGIYLNKHVNDEVSKGETIFTLYSDSEDRLERAKAYFAGVEGIKIY